MMMDHIDTIMISGIESKFHLFELQLNSLESDESLLGLGLIESKT